MIFDKDLLEDTNEFYELDWWGGKTKSDLESFTGFKFSSKEEEFKNALKELLKILVKGKEMSVRNVRFKVKNTAPNAQFLVIMLTDDIYGEGKVKLSWTFDGRKSGNILQGTKVKGCDPVLAKRTIFAVKFLIDGLLDNVFGPEKIESFTVGFDEQKDKCNSCGQVFRTVTGLTEHKCSFLIKDDAFEPMEFTNQISNDANKVVQALVGHVQDTGLLKGQPTLPAPPRLVLSCADYVRRELPGGEIRSVMADGACLPRAISFICFGTEQHWKILAKAINKKTIELFESLKEYLSFPLVRKVSGKEGETEFKNKDEYFKFLMSDDSLFMRREGPDLT